VKILIFNSLSQKLFTSRH